MPQQASGPSRSGARAKREGVAFGGACAAVACRRRAGSGPVTRSVHPTPAYLAMETPAKVPRWYWVVSILAVLWMSFGVLAWFMDLMMDDAAIAGMSDAQREVYLSRPSWLFGVYAVAVFSGFIGALGLLLRRAWAVVALGVSLAAVVVQFGYSFLALDMIRRLGAGVALPFPVVIFGIGVLLLWLGRRARTAGWLG